ncbi:MAG: hypothetical protein P8R54_33465 [Myxococcota bacterium]|nr:hypothetical protein [Myxococcota bacterium]
MLDHLRAIFVVLHLIAITAVAFPAPVGMRRADLDNPDVQAAIEAWRGVAGAAGLAVDAEAFREQLWVAGSQMLAARRSALAPLQPYYRYAGTSQGWAMFGYLNHTPARLEIHIDNGTGWEPLFIARTTAHTWRAHQFDQERVRGLVNAFSWRSSRRRMRALADWVAVQAAADFPAARRIRLQMHTRPLPDPQELRESRVLAHTKTYWPELRELK